MRGFFPVKGLIASVLVGAGAGVIASRLIPPTIPYQAPIAGFAVGGLPGAAGAYLMDMLQGGATTTGGGSSSFYL